MNQNQQYHGDTFSVDLESLAAVARIGYGETDDRGYFVHLKSSNTLIQIQRSEGERLLAAWQAWSQGETGL